MPLAVALLSGGLDSRLAIRLMQEQGVQVQALNFQTIFTCCQASAAQAAADLNVPLTVISQADDYLDVIRRPRFGYGRGANPCVDCRIYMFQLAKHFMEQIGASFVVSGEVVGQRPMSQKKRDLAVIARHSGLEDRLLRPLSAKCLPPTLPERNGEVDREQLFDFTGRSRKGLIELARRFGFDDIPSPSSGCTLTEPGFATKVHDLIQLQPDNGRWDFELLKIGRHVRVNGQTKIVIGRNEIENQMLERLFVAPDASATALLRPDNFQGPAALVIGPATPAALDFAGGLLLRYAHHSSPQDVSSLLGPARARVTQDGVEHLRDLASHSAAETAATL